MVTAGVYLLIRSSPLIEYSSTVLIICLWLGAITTVVSSLVGLFQQDIKKVIAYSTMSQMAQECNFTFRHQTICVEVDFINNFHNSQITKTHDYLSNHINYNLFNSPFIYWLHYYLFLLSNLSVWWKIIIISKLVGISEAIRLILIFIKRYFFYNLFIFIKKNLILFSSLTKKYNSITSDAYSKDVSTNLPKNSPNLKNLAFNQWLAGLIDGDGYFILTKKGYTSCEITMDARDKKALTEIKQKYGGNIRSVSNSYAVRYKLRHKKGLISLINDINGLIRNPIRLLQLNKLCTKYNIKLKYPKNLTFNDGWLSGIIDSDGSVYYNESSGQIFISITQKNKYLLEPLIKLYGGRIDILSPKIEAFKYIVYRKSELTRLIDNYFLNYPLKTEKMKRINLIKDFYDLKLSKNKELITPQKLNEWIKFKDKWEKYKN